MSFLRCEPLAWWTKVVAFTMGDFAFLTLTDVYFGPNLTVFAIGVCLVPLVLILSWISARRSNAKATSALATATAAMRVFDQGFLQGLHGSTQMPPIQAQEYVRERVTVEDGRVTIDRWFPRRIQPYADGSTNYSGSVETGSHTQNPVSYEYNIRVARDGNVISNQSSVMRVNVTHSP